jgi:hypothetical protein
MVAEDKVALHEVVDGICGEAAFDKNFESIVEKLDSKLVEGTCASAGYTKEDGSKDVKIPYFGDVTFSLFTKAAKKENPVQFII